MTEAATSTWAERLRRVIGDRGRVTLLAETDSTQDAARRLAARPGDAVVALRQTAGRGRQGRRWHDPDGHGIAVTIVAPAGPPESLAIGAAVGVAEAAERLLGRAAAIKWPNDVLADGRKLAGILVEVTGDTALVGVGMNVRRRSWPGDLGDRAVCLAELGAPPDRLAAIEAVLATVPPALARPLDDELLEAYRRRLHDDLRGPPR